jgi:hypothetical protein
MKNFYKFKPLKYGQIEDNILIFWQFRPCKINGFKKYFKNEVWTYFFPLFIHEFDNKLRLCPFDTYKYISLIYPNEAKKPICNVCEENKKIYDELSAIKSKINIDNAVDTQSYNDILSNSENYSKIKLKLLKDVVKVKYLFLILDYNEYLKNIDNENYVFELKWAIGDEEILNYLQNINNIGYNICNLSTLHFFHIIKNTNYDEAKYYIIPDKNFANLKEKNKNILNEADYEINLLKLIPFVR